MIIENNQPPVVSVIVPAYNAAATLARTIESVRAQTFLNWELIVINDGSTDSTTDIVESFIKTDLRVRLVNMEQNSGQSAARNAGFRASKGKWLAILDADDVYLSKRLETLLAHAENNHLDMIADNQLFYDARMNVISRTAMPNMRYAVPWSLLDHLKNDKVEGSFKWGLLKPIINRAFLEKTGVIYRTQFKMGEDSLLYMELLMHGAHAEVSHEALYIYTTAIGEISRQKAGTSTSAYKLDDHMGTYLFFRETYATQLTPEIEKAIAKCEQAATAADHATKFKTEIRSKKVFAAMRRILQHRELVSFVWLSLTRFIKSKLRLKPMGQ